jgi:AcrR family transcriptional regulator
MPRKPSGNPTGRPKEFCEKQALQAAMGVFAEKGYENASLADLTSAMKINRFSMYSSFGNKEQLYVRTMEIFNQARRERVAEFLSGPSARQSMDRWLRDIVEKFTEEGHGVCFVTQAPLSPEAASKETRDLMEKRRMEVEQAIKRRLERAIEEGELPAGTCAGALAAFYAVIIQGMALQAQHGGKREDLMGVVDVAMSKWPDPKSMPFPG